MRALATIYEMTPRMHETADERTARALRARRSYLGKTQEEMVDESEGSQKWGLGRDAPYFSTGRDSPRVSV